MTLSYLALFWFWMHYAGQLVVAAYNNRHSGVTATNDLSTGTSNEHHFAILAGRMSAGAQARDPSSIYTRASAVT